MRQISNKRLRNTKNKPIVVKANNRQRRDAQYYTLSFKRQPAYFMPLTYRTTLIYYEQVDFSAVTTPQVYTFRANSVYDPDQSGTGQQPVGYDEMMAIYNAAFVVGSRISMTVVNQGSQPIQFAVAPSIASNNLTTYDQFETYGRCVNKSSIDGITRGSNSFKTIHNEVVTLSFYGQPYDRDFMSVGSANPSKQLYWLMGLQTADRTSTLSCNLKVRVMYDVIFSDPIYVAQS